MLKKKQGNEDLQTIQLTQITFANMKKLTIYQIVTAKILSARSDSV